MVSRATKARMEVLNVLKSNSMPLSADELTPKINREVVSGSSVYRILSELEKVGILKKHLDKTGYTTIQFMTHMNTI